MVAAHQRKMILDVILESRCFRRREICQVEKLDRNIGIVTVCHLKELENIAVLSRKIVYK